MKYILTLFCLVSFVAYGQEPAYTPMRLNYQFRGIKVDSLLLIPSFNDTTAANNSTMKNVAGAMIRTGNDFYMRNATTNAWLQNVNVGTGASPSIQFVDSVWRVVGKDSIFWRKGGTTNKIKDSTGKADSPDRIAGTATTSVTANMANYDLRFNNTGTFEVSSNYTFIKGTDSIRLKNNNIEHLTKGNKYTLKDFNNTFLEIDTLGNAKLGDITDDTVLVQVNASTNKIILKSPKPIEFNDQNSALTSYVRTGYVDNAVDVSVTDYNILAPGLYIVTTGGGNTLYLPDPTLWKGQNVHIVNDTGGNLTVDGNGGTIYKQGVTAVTTMADKQTLVVCSDGVNWYGYLL